MRRRVIGAARSLSVLASSVLLSVSAFAQDAERRTSLMQAEVGAGTDVSNEIFVEDAYADTTFLGRRLVGSPETRWSALGRLSLEGPERADGRRYRLEQDASIGDLLQRGTLSGMVQGPLGLADSWRIAPRIEYRHDRTFGRDLTQWQGDLGTRLKHSSDDGARLSEVGLASEFSRASGRGAELVPDRWVARTRVGFDAAPLEGPEWHLGYAFAARSFPDSTSRDHLEHGLESRLRLRSGDGHALELEFDADRRAARHAVPTSRDRFVRGRGAVEVTACLGDRWQFLTRCEIEAMRYDVPDSALYFDYHVSRMSLAPRFESGAWSAALGPRAEFLTATAAPAEAYREIAAAGEFESVAGHAWWSFAPAGGWRGYSLGSAPDLPVLHSSYAFAEAALMFDQPLLAGVRLRGSGLMRCEWHQDATQDARSLYFSLELRRLL